MKLSLIEVYNLTKGQRGFTVFELMIALIISAIVAFIAVPNYSVLSAGIERMNTRKMVLQDLRRAQAEAVTHGCRGIFRINADNKSYSFGCDYLPYDVTSPPSADVIAYSRSMPQYFFISADNTIIFNSRGQIVDEVNLIDSRTVSLTDITSGSTFEYASGVIAGTGVFEYD